MDVRRDPRAVDRDEARGPGEADVLAQLGDQRDALLLELLLGPHAVRVDEVEDLLRERPKLVVLRDRLRLAADGDHRPVVGVHAMLDEAFGGGTAGPLPRLGHALLAQETLRSLEVAARLLERPLAVHHPRTGLVAD